MKMSCHELVEVERLVELVRDLIDAGETHGMDISEMVDFFGDAYKIPKEIREAAEEILYS